MTLSIKSACANPALNSVLQLLPSKFPSRISVPIISMKVSKFCKIDVNFRHSVQGYWRRLQYCKLHLFILDSQQFISEASRERCWRQWLSKAENKICGDPNKVFLQFQAIANSFNEDVLHQAALELENSEIWRESANLRSWFNSNWLLEAKVKCIILSKHLSGYLFKIQYF